MSQPVYLVRHGQSEWNARRLTQGQIHHPRLTALGRTQAAAAADVLAATLPAGRQARLLTSDLARAVETARIIGERLGLEPEHDVRLREQHLGSLQGRSYDDPRPATGGESPRQVAARMTAVLAGLDRARPTVLVSHGDAIRAALDGTGAPETPATPEVPNGAVARLDGVTRRWLSLPEPARSAR